MSERDHTQSLEPGAFVAAITASLIGLIVVYAISIATYTETGIPDADDTMRLVTMRDLLAGQGWFDPAQYRLGLEGGTLMHWSRLVDAPILGFYHLAYWVTSDAQTAEIFIKFAWPATTLFIALMGINVACNRMGWSSMRGPATILATVCFMTIGVFGPGSLDHHNIQVALSIWLIALLIPRSDSRTRAIGTAGFIAVLMLAIGMETLPYVTVAGIWVALAFLFGVITPAAARTFGLYFAGASILILLLTVEPSAYLNQYCDAYSIFHVGMSSIAGVGLVLASLFAHSLSARLTGSSVIAVIAAAALMVLFPQCLTNPLSTLDPKLVEYWLEGVVETRSIVDLWTSDPFALFGMFGMAVTGLFASIYLAVKRTGKIRNLATLSIGLLVVAIGVTAWQQRGSMFAASFAILPLAYLLTELRTRYQQTETTGALLKMAGVGVLSFNMLWWIVGANAAKIFSDAPTLQEQAASASPRDFCYTEDVYALLAEQPKGVVLGATDIGASILNFTDHRALAGPYHRNTAGNLVMIETMLAAPQDAHKFLKEAGVTIIADCINSVDARDFKRGAPAGLQAALHSGEIPHYLELIAETKDAPLVLYRVKN